MNSPFSGANVNGFTPMKGNYSQSQNDVMQTPSKVITQEACLLPLMIEQIVNAEEPKGDEGISIDGIEVTQVTVIGSVIKTEIQSLNTTITVSDGTGEIDVKVWHQENESKQMDNSELYKEGTKVRVVGKLRLFNKNRNIMCFRMLKIENEMEEELHKLEVKYAHLVNTKVKNNLTTNNENTNSNNNTNSNTNNNSNNNVPKFSNMTNEMNSMNISNPNSNRMEIDNYNEDNGLTLVQNQVLNFVGKYNNTESGVNMMEIMKSMKIDPNQIRDAIEHLVNEGAIYSTVDDEHYKLTRDN